MGITPFITPTGKTSPAHLPHNKTRTRQRQRQTANTAKRNQQPVVHRSNGQRNRITTPAKPLRKTPRDLQIFDIPHNLSV